MLEAFRSFLQATQPILAEFGLDWKHVLISTIGCATVLAVRFLRAKQYIALAAALEAVIRGVQIDGDQALKDTIKDEAVRLGAEKVLNTAVLGVRAKLKEELDKLA